MTRLVGPRLAALSLVYDRAEASRLLARMPASLASAHGVAVGAPAWAELASLEEADVLDALQGAQPASHCHPALTPCVARPGANIALPCLLKPRAGCGQEGSHTLCLLADAAAARSCSLRLPGLLQAFVPHSPVVHKAYCFGDRVLTEARRSLPPLPSDCSRLSGQLCFDALPAEWTQDGDAGEAGEAPLCPAAVEAIACWLRAESGLELFGFDVLVESGSGRHLVVDLNFFPSARGVAGAPEALAEALRAMAGGSAV